jgi:hypothetical protein
MYRFVFACLVIIVSAPVLANNVTTSPDFRWCMPRALEGNSNFCVASFQNSGQNNYVISWPSKISCDGGHSLPVQAGATMEQSISGLQAVLNQNGLPPPDCRFVTSSRDYATAYCSFSTNGKVLFPACASAASMAAVTLSLLVTLLVGVQLI